MALYTYFRNKDDLYDAVRDHLMGLLPAVPQDVAWPDQVRAVCRSLRLLMLQHPCLAQLLAGRPLSGHETARVAEGLLGVLRSAGFDPETAARTHTTLFTYVLGATSWEIQMAAERRTRTRGDDCGRRWSRSRAWTSRPSSTSRRSWPGRRAATSSSTTAWTCCWRASGQNTIVTMATMPMQTIRMRSATGGSLRP